MQVEALSEPVSIVLKSLPPFPQVAMRALDVLSQEDAVIKQVAELLRMDQAFGAEILKLANSAAYGFRSRIDSLSQAIVLLGTERVKSLTLTVAMQKYAGGAFRDAVLKRCWHQSLATAFLSEQLAPLFRLGPDRAYTAGLMRDIGRLALLVGYPEQYSKLVEAADEQRLDIVDVERSMFGIDHRDAGKWLALEWKFPPELCEVIAERDHVWFPDPIHLATLVQLASHLADVVGFAAYRPPSPWTLEEILEYLPEQSRPSFENAEELKDRILCRIATFGIQ